MAWPDPNTTRNTDMGMDRGSIGTASQSDVAYDEGLRSYMLKVYNYMASGILLTGVGAMLFANSETGRSIMTGGGFLPLAIAFSPLIIVLIMSFGQNKLSTPALQAMFWGFATLLVL
jgi:FtsH-binding integral membrane protein